MKNKQKKHKTFSEQEETSIVRYGAVLLGIHARLVIEGYFLEGEKIWNIFKAGTSICEIILED